MDANRPLDPDAARLVARLRLAPHPEGGFYRETYRSPLKVETSRGERAAVTAIHFLMPPGTVSVFHRVLADEIWTHAGGDALELHVVSPSGRYELVRLGRDVDSEHTHAVVPAGHWQAAKPAGARYVLATCVVAPGFQFSDFELARRSDLSAAFPALHKDVLALAAP